jgi:Tol biopolymer transport system component
MLLCFLSSSAGPTAGAGSVVTAVDVSTAMMPGMVAVVSDGSLDLIAHGVTHVVSVADSPSAPAWSADGVWVAFLSTPAPPVEEPYDDQPSQLWVARADGTDAHAVTPRTLDVMGFAWDPAPSTERLAFTGVAATGGTGEVAVTSPLSSHPTVVVSQAYATFAWSPSGTTLAVGFGLRPAGPTDRLVGVLDLVHLDGTEPQAVVKVPGAPVEVATWWPDGKGVVFWRDSDGSSSLAADGLPLESVDLSTGHVRTLATTLVHLDWLAWSPSGTTLAVVAGPNRSVWDSGRHLDLCTVPEDTCKTLTQPTGTVSLDPAWTTTGTLMFVRAPGTVSNTMGPPPGIAGGADAPYGEATITQWEDAQHIWTATATGTGPGLLTAVGAGAHTPTTISGGMLYIRDDNLWYLPTTGTAVDVTGPVGTPNPYESDYYGYIPWAYDFAWHA